MNYYNIDGYNIDNIVALQHFPPGENLGFQFSSVS